MPLVERQIWTPARRILGNLVPMLLCLPFGVVGVLLYRIEKPFELIPLVALFLFPIVGWLSTNVMGLWDNEKMRAELARRLGRTQGGQKHELVFVGTSSLTYRGALDPHEDIGFLIFCPDRLEIFGDKRQSSIARKDVLKIVRRGNAHSLVSLGGWIAILTVQGGILVEPREYGSLLRNKAYSKDLKARLEAWLEGDSPTEPPSSPGGSA